MLHLVKTVVKLMMLLGGFATVWATVGWMMRRLSLPWRRRALLAFVTVLVLVQVKKVLYRSIPPFEQGVHEQVVEAQSGRGRADGPRVAGCPIFPADSYWNTPVDGLKLDPRSDAYIKSIGPVVRLHPDFASVLTSGIPFTEITPAQKRVKIVFDYKDDSDLGNYPIPPDAPIEGGPGAKPDDDRHMILIDTRRCLLYEIYQATPLPDGTWKAGSGIQMDLTSNYIRPDGKGSADAAGMPIFPGLVRYDEVQAGVINHAIRFTIPHTQHAFVWPARHQASPNRSLDVAPMGERFRLKASFDVSSYSRSNQVILTALKKYGMILADNGGGIFISGVPDKRWNDDDLHQLGSIRATDFEAVDESDWPMIADSGRVDPTLVKR